MAVHLLRSDSGWHTAKNYNNKHIKRRQIEMLKKRKICIPLLAKYLFKGF